MTLHLMFTKALALQATLTCPLAALLFHFGCTPTRIVNGESFPHRNPTRRISCPTLYTDSLSPKKN